MKIGYIRVSTEEQNTVRQEVLMEELGVDEIYINKASGKSSERPQLKKMMQFVRRGDVIIVESISRFARNTKDLLNLIEDLSVKDVTFISKKEAILIQQRHQVNLCLLSSEPWQNWNGNIFYKDSGKE